MKNSILSIIVLGSISLASCDMGSEQFFNDQDLYYIGDEEYSDFEEDYADYDEAQSNYSNQNNPNMRPANYSNQNSAPRNNGGIKNVAIPHSQTGQTVSHLPVPTSWRFTKQGFRGPNGLEAGDIPSACYFSKGNERIVSLQEVVNENMRSFKQQGVTVTNTFELPRIAQAVKSMHDQLWTISPVQKNYKAVGIECVMNGQKTLWVLTHWTSRNQFTSGWNLITQKMIANDNYFETAKREFIYALENQRYDNQYVAMHNQREQSRANMSNANFQNRMRSNQAAFEATNRATVNSFNEISDMQMDTWRRNNASQDRMQYKQVEGIWERSTVRDMNNGNLYQVEGQANHYWMDGQGNYVPSNDANWNPNLDNAYNNNTWWTEAENMDGGY